MARQQSDDLTTSDGDDSDVEVQLEAWSSFYRCVSSDIFRRGIVAWCIADAASAALFKPLFAAADAHARRRDCCAPAGLTPAVSGR
jgi:hypothetical protein